MLYFHGLDHLFGAALAKVAPFHIRTILTDNDKEFTDRFITAGRELWLGNMPLTNCALTWALNID